MKLKSREVSSIYATASREPEDEKIDRGVRSTEPEGIKEWIRSELLKSGACAVGFAKAEAVEPSEWRLFQDWLERGDCAGMEYMKNYPELRRDPRGLLDGAKTVISLAFSFKPARWREAEGEIACYAYGKDYHKQIRKLLKVPLCEISNRLPDAVFRICVDSAPVLERYWALKAGIGFRGDNGCVIVPGAGSMVFLAEVLTNIEIEADERIDMNCGHCGECRRVCPGKALGDTIDCRKCLSYLTIEHKGEWKDPGSISALESEAGRNTIFGCDRCLRICPHNKIAPSTEIEAFGPLDSVMEVSRDVLEDWQKEGYAGEKKFKEIFGGSPLVRAGLSGLCRNIKHPFVSSDQCSS